MKISSSFLSFSLSFVLSCFLTLLLSFILPEIQFTHTESTYPLIILHKQAMNDMVRGTGDPNLPWPGSDSHASLIWSPPFTV
jgi:hypothetical protein